MSLAPIQRELEAAALPASPRAVADPARDSVLSTAVLNEAGRRAYLALFFLERFLGARRFSKTFGRARARNRARTLRVLGDRPSGLRIPVREVAFSSHQDFFKDPQAAIEPVVFRGLAADWPAMKLWDLDYFAREYGGSEVAVVDEVGLAPEEEQNRFEVLPLGEIIAGMRAGGKRYLRFSPIAKQHPELQEHVDMEWLRGFRSKLSVREEPQMFIGPAGSCTPIHCALENNVFVQVRGKKRWLLYPARYQQLLEPHANGRPYFHSDFLPERAGSQSALGELAPALEVVLEEGDVLYNPPFVWHFVENLTESISFSYRYLNVRAGLRSSWPLLLLRFMATDPSLVRSLYHSIRGSSYIFERTPQDEGPRSTQPSA